MTYSELGYMEVLIIEFRINPCIYYYDVYIEAFTVNVITINAKVDRRKYARIRNLKISKCVIVCRTIPTWTHNDVLTYVRSLRVEVPELWCKWVVIELCLLYYSG